MTSILSFIKRYALETILILFVILFLIFNPFSSGDNTGEGEAIQQIRTELSEIRDSNKRILDGISEYEKSSRERDQNITELRELIESEIGQLTITIESARQSDLSTGDRNIEAGILIDENRRILRELREGE